MIAAKKDKKTSSQQQALGDPYNIFIYKYIFTLMMIQKTTKISATQR